MVKGKEYRKGLKYVHTGRKNTRGVNSSTLREGRETGGFFLTGVTPLGLGANASKVLQVLKSYGTSHICWCKGTCLLLGRALTRCCATSTMGMQRCPRRTRSTSSLLRISTSSPTIGREPRVSITTFYDHINDILSSASVLCADACSQILCFWIATVPICFKI